MVLNTTDAQTPPRAIEPDDASRWYTLNGSISRKVDGVVDSKSFSSREDSAEDFPTLLDWKKYVEMDDMLDRTRAA
jgi:hypothetical protein